jgi:hypothetical protein
MRLALFISRAWCVSCAFCACVDLPEFPRPSLIDRPRVLAIVAEPPEAAPGQPVELSLLLAGASSAEITWRACGAFDSFTGGGSQYGDETEEHCGSERGDVLEPGERTQLPGALTSRLFDDLELAAAILGSALPLATVALIRDEVGLPFVVEATVIADGKLIRAVKRVVISPRERRNTNPPPPRFSLAGQEIAAERADSFRCDPLEGGVARGASASDIELRPLFEGDSEPWIEAYPVLDARGALVRRSERAFYSWFSSAGELAESITTAPLSSQRWTTPPAAGCHALWLVIRDGHGGASACRTEVAIDDAECP